MSGVAVIVALLKASAQVTAIVPTARIMAGDLPVNTVLPAIGVTQISSVPYNAIRTNELPKRHSDRVQVSWLFKGPEGSPGGSGYPGVAAMGRLVLRACRNQRGVVNGVYVESIIPDVEGPDLSDDAAALQSRSRDFLVGWVEYADALLAESGDDFITDENGEIITVG